MDKIEQQHQHFNSVAKEYYEARRNANHLRFKERLFSHVLKEINVDRSKTIKVLEPMCGFGEGRDIVCKYISDNIEYEGFDYSEVLIEELKTIHPKWKAYQQDVTTFEAEANYYDIIILIGGLHHVPDYAEKVCSNLGRALKRGGLFINFEPTNNNPLIKCIREAIYKKNHLFDAETERAFSLKKYNKMFKDSGLVVEKQFFPGLLGYVMYYNPDAFPALNRGTTKTVDKVFEFEYKNYTRFLGRWASFCTFSVFRKV